MQAGVDFWPRRHQRHHQERRVRHRRQPDRRVRRLRRATRPPKASRRATTRTVVGGSLAILALDFVLTVFMFRGLGDRLDGATTRAIMNRATIDLWVGIFVTIGIGAIVFLALKVGNLATLQTTPSYHLEARFDNIGGLKLRAPVKAAGVVVGRVESRSSSTPRPTRPSSRCASTTATSSRRTRSRRSSRPGCSARSTSASTPGGDRRCSPTAGASRRRSPRSCSRS